MLSKYRHRRARCEGYQARINNMPMSKNRYSSLGKPGQVYASIWDSGWLEADKNIKQTKER
jgi:hypothetical protein